MPTDVRIIFACGFFGSVAVEIVGIIQVFQTEPIVFPERYKRIGFWITRFLLAILGGGLAVAYEIKNIMAAANIGASAPLIVQALAQGLKPAITTYPPSSTQPDRDIPSLARTTPATANEEPKN